MKNITNSNFINFTSLNRVLNETVEFLKKNSLKSFHCKCNGAYNFDSEDYSPLKNKIIKNSPTTRLVIKEFSSSSSSSSSSISLSNIHQKQIPHFNNNQTSVFSKHQPTTEFLIKCVHLVQELFNVDCFLNIPTKLNEIYYKLGQLHNFKKGIQNIFDPGNY